MVPSPVSSKRLSCARVDRCWNGQNAPVNKIHSYAWIYFPSKKEQNSLLTPTLSPLFWNCDLVLDCYCCTSTRVKISSHSPSIKMPGRRSLHPPLPLPWPRHHASGEGISYSKPNGRITWKSPWHIHSMHFFISHVFPKKNNQSIRNILTEAPKKKMKREGLPSKPSDSMPPSWHAPAVLLNRCLHVPVPRFVRRNWPGSNQMSKRLIEVSHRLS